MDLCLYTIDEMEEPWPSKSLFHIASFSTFSINTNCHNKLCTIFVEWRYTDLTVTSEQLDWSEDSINREN